MNSTPEQRHVPLHRFITATIGYGMYALANFLFLFCIPVLLLLLPWPSLFHTVIGRLVKGYLYFLTRVFLPMLRIYRVVEFSGFDTIPKDKPSILVANHRSRIDGPMLLGELDTTGVVMKSSYSRFPVFSIFVKHFDYISVDPVSLDSLAAALARCKEFIDRGYRILVFPEGARARSSRLQDFKDLAFRIASEKNLPVYPVIVHTDHPFMAKIKGSIFPPYTMRFTVRVLSPVYRNEQERPPELAARVRRRMDEELELLDKGTIWERI